jgi:predicted HTH domain antitoxin
MPVVIPDEVVQQTRLSERELLIEIACRLFDLEKLDLWPAAKLAGLTRTEMEDELMRRQIPVYRPTVADLQQDLANLERFEERLRREQAAREALHSDD